MFVWYTKNIYKTNTMCMKNVDHGFKNILNVYVKHVLEVYKKCILCVENCLLPLNKFPTY